VGEEVAIKDKNAPERHGLEARNVAPKPEFRAWLEQGREQFKSKVVALPKREDMQTPPINDS